jgi:hypothetical protein
MLGFRHYAECRDWGLNLYLETTITQALKQKQQADPEVYEVLDAAKKYIADLLRAHPTELHRLAKFFTYRYYKQPEDEQRGIGQFIIRAMPAVRDFLVSKITDMDQGGKIIDGHLRSNLNSPKYTIDDLKKDSEAWHEKLAAQEAGKGEEGKVVVKLDKLGPRWKGWKWINLERSSCRVEGGAMGHCGNAGGHKNDEIFSLRDENDYVYLTFIVRKYVSGGALGESKGRGNSKPTAKYHPAIVELLKSKYIATIVGGGYLPENNFHFKDLDKDTREELEELKPQIDNPYDFLADHMAEEVEELEGNYSHLRFAHFGSEMSEDYRGDEEYQPFIYYWGGYGLTLPSDILIKDIPGWGEPGRDDLMDALRKVTDDLELWAEEFEIEQQRDGIWVRGDIREDEDYHTPAGSVEAYENFLSFLDSEIEPKEKALANRVQHILIELGYAELHYISKKSGHGEPQHQWHGETFRHFTWDEENHELMVWTPEPGILLGSMKGQESGWQGRYAKNVNQEAPGFKEFYKILTEKMNQVSKAWEKAAVKQQFFPTFKMKPKQSMFSGEHVIKPEVKFSYDEDENVFVVLNFEFGLHHHEKDIKDAEGFIKFLDYHYNRFVQEAQQIFEMTVKPKYNKPKEPQQQAGYYGVR